MEEQQFLITVIEEATKALAAGGYKDIEYFDENIVAMNGPSGQNLDGEETVARMLKPANAGNIIITLSYSGKGKYSIIATLGGEVDFAEFDKTVGDILKQLAGTWGSKLDYRLDTWGGEIKSKYPKDIKGNIQKQIQGVGGVDTMDKQISEANAKMTGTTRSSYQKVGECKVIIRHSGRVNENKFGARSRNIDSIFIETKGGERFKMAENNLHGARAMARHLSNDGSPFDTVGNKITTMMNEMKQLREMAVKARNFGRRTALTEEQSGVIMEIKERYVGLRENLKNMSGKVGYMKHTTPIQEAEKMEIDTETKAAKNKKEEETVLKDQAPVYDRPTDGKDKLVRDADDLFSVNENKYGVAPEENILESWFNEEFDAEFYKEEELVIEDAAPEVKKTLPENALGMLNMYMGHPLFNHYMKLYEEQEILDEVLSMIEEDSKLWESVTASRGILNEFDDGTMAANLDQALARINSLTADRRLSTENAINQVAEEIAGEDDEEAFNNIKEKLWGMANDSGLVKHDFGSTFSDEVLAPNETVSAHNDEIDSEEYYGDAMFAESAMEWNPGYWHQMEQMLAKGSTADDIMTFAHEEFDNDMDSNDIHLMVFDFFNENGVDYDADTPDDEPFDHDDMYDIESGLGSAGMGTDEYYGDFGGDDFYEMNQMRKNAGMEPLVREEASCACGCESGKCNCGPDCGCDCHKSSMEEGDPFGRQSKRNLKNPKSRMSLINPEDKMNHDMKSLGEDDDEFAKAVQASNKEKSDRLRAQGDEWECPKCGFGYKGCKCGEEEVDEKTLLPRKKTLDAEKDKSDDVQSHLKKKFANKPYMKEDEIDEAKTKPDWVGNRERTMINKLSRGDKAPYNPRDEEEPTDKYAQMAKDRGVTGKEKPTHKVRGVRENENYVEVDMPHHLPQTEEVHTEEPTLSEDGARIIELARYKN